MNTYRIHSQLATALRSLAQIRDELRSERTSWLERLVCKCRWLFFSLRVRQLIDRLHSR